MKRGLPFVAVLLLVAPLVSCSTVYLIASTHSVPSSDYVVAVDTTTGSLVKKFHTNPELSAQYDFVSGGAVVNNTYYAVETQFPVTMAVVSIDLKTHRTTTLNTTGLFHALWPDPSGQSTLIAVQNDPASKLDFSVVRITDLGGGRGTQTTIGKFPTAEKWGGQDAIFTFEPTTKTVWATFPRSSGASGHLVMLSISTGEVTGNYDYTHVLGTNNWPLYAVPTPDATSGGRFGGVMMRGENNDPVWCTLRIEGKSVKQQDCQAATGLAGGIPIQTCGGEGYVIVGETLHGPLTVFDTSTGLVKKSISTQSLGVDGDILGALGVSC